MTTAVTYPPSRYVVLMVDHGEHGLQAAIPVARSALATHDAQLVADLAEEARKALATAQTRGARHRLEASVPNQIDLHQAGEPITDLALGDFLDHVKLDVPAAGLVGVYGALRCRARARA